MKVSEVIKALEASIKEFGDHEVKVGANLGEKRVEQIVVDVLSGGQMVILVSKGFMEEDPLMKLPHLSLAQDGPFEDPH